VNGSHKDQWRERLERDGRLRSALEEQLVPQEAVEVIAYGASGSAVIGTPARALVFKRGIKAGIPFGHRLKSFEYESVVAINVREIDEGLVLAVHAPLKVGSCVVYWLDERDDAWKARNAIVAPPEDRGALESAAADLREAVSAHHARHGRATPAAESRLAPVPIPPAIQSCTACGAEVVAGWRYCPECGASFAAPPLPLNWPHASHGAGR
jgi:hypothetical protein